MTGGAIGCAVALLSAPSSGEELRHTIGRNYRKASKKIGRYSEDLRDRADDLLEHTHELLEHTHDLRELGSKLLHFRRGSRAA